MAASLHEIEVVQFFEVFALEQLFYLALFVVIEQDRMGKFERSTAA